MSGVDELALFSSSADACRYVRTYVMDNLSEVFGYGCDIVAWDAARSREVDLLADTSLVADGAVRCYPSRGYVVLDAGLAAEYTGFPSYDTESDDEQALGDKINLAVGDKIDLAVGDALNNLAFAASGAAEATPLDDDSWELATRSEVPDEGAPACFSSVILRFQFPPLEDMPGVLMDCPTPVWE